MAQIHDPAPVKFFVAVLAADAGYLPLVKSRLEQEWGAVAVESGPLPFSYTSYYRDETGPNITRAFLGFEGFINPGELAGRKVKSNAIEEEFAASLGSHYPRPVNLDPGTLAPDKMVLATAKNFAHRIYIGLDIYADLTLLYRHDRFEPLEWTFPDYASGAYFPFFLALRERLMAERVLPAWYSV